MKKVQTHFRERLRLAILQTKWKKYSQTRPEGVLIVLLSTLVSTKKLLVLSFFVSTKKCFPSTLYWIKWRRRNVKTISIGGSLITNNFHWPLQRAVKLYANCLVNHRFIVQFAARIWKKQVSAALMFKFLWKEAKHVTQPHLCNSCWNMFDNCWSCLTFGVWR